MPWGDDPSLIIPLEDRVLVKTIKEQRQGKVILPDSAKGRPELAHVLSIGPGRRSERTREVLPMPDIEVGDVVIFHRLAGTHIGGFSDDYIIFHAHDLLAKVVDPKVLAEIAEWEAEEDTVVSAIH